MTKCLCRACNEASECPLLNRQFLNILHELLGGCGIRTQKFRPILGPRGENHLVPLPPNEDLRGSELKLLRKPDCLTPIIHEYLGCTLHSTLLNHGIYISICHAGIHGNKRNLEVKSATGNQPLLPSHAPPNPSLYDERIDLFCVRGGQESWLDSGVGV